MKLSGNRETPRHFLSVFEWWGLLSDPSGTAEHKLGVCDKPDGGYVSLHASNGSLRSDSQDQICVYLQPGSQEKRTFLRVWSEFRLMGLRLDDHQTEGGLKQLLCLHLAAGGDGRIGGRNMRVREE